MKTNLTASTPAPDNNGKRNQRKAGPVRTVRISDPAAMEAAATAAGQPGELQALLASQAIAFDMSAIAPQRGKTGGTAAKATAAAINWPADVAQLATALEIHLTETEPVRGRCVGKGQLFAGPGKKCKHIGRPIPTPATISRNDESAVWVAWAVNGASGAVPSMANGETLSMVDLLRLCAGAPLGVRQAASFRRLWAGSSTATSVLGLIAAHTGRIAKLSLETFTVTLH